MLGVVLACVVNDPRDEYRKVHRLRLDGMV